MDGDTQNQGLHGLTTEIVAAFVGNHSVPIADLPEVIAMVFGALGRTTQVEPEQAAAPVPAVPTRKSIGQDFLICLEDGHKVTMLKRYLATRYQLTPEQYRQRWGLPETYPMVAPAYAEHRSQLAREMGLGRKRVTEAPSPAPPPAPAASESRRRAAGRRKTA